jgi:hypothetical protein
MTIPETPAFRTTKPDPARTKAHRDGAGGGGAGGSNNPGGTAPNATGRVSSATERAVKSGYRAVAENIIQARIAAEKFRQGKYNINNVPDDLDQMSKRLPDVVRDFSSAGIELMQWIIKAAGPSAGDPACGDLNLRVDFENDEPNRASALTDTLARPMKDVGPDSIRCAGLQRPGDSSGIIPVGFRYDLRTEELVATMTIPRLLEDGVYSALVYAVGQDAPLGVLSVEITNPKAETEKST